MFIKNELLRSILNKNKEIDKIKKKSFLSQDRKH